MANLALDDECDECDLVYTCEQECRHSSNCIVSSDGAYRSYTNASSASWAVFNSDSLGIRLIAAGAVILPPGTNNMKAETVGL